MDIRRDENENNNNNNNNNNDSNGNNGNGINIDTIIRFAYCKNCQKGYKLPRGDLTPNIINCAICNFQAITVTKPDGKSHTICPQCFKYVPSQFLFELLLFHHFILLIFFLSFVLDFFLY